MPGVLINVGRLDTDAHGGGARGTGLSVSLLPAAEPAGTERPGAHLPLRRRGARPCDSVASHVPPPGHGTTHPRRLSHPACGARAGGPGEDAPVARGAAGSAGGSLALPVCGRDSPSARGGATSQLVTSEAHVQRRGPAAGDRAGGGRRGCPSEAASARVPMSRPAGSSSDARSSVSLLVRRRVLSSWWPSGSSTAKAPRAEGAAPAAVTGRVRGARGGRAAPSARARVYGAQRRDQQLGSGNAARLHVSGLRQCDSGNPAAAESHSKFTPAFTALWLFTLETASSRGGAGRTGGGAESTAATVLRSPAPRGRQDPVPRSVPACVLLTHQTTSAGVARRCRGRWAARPSRQPREVTSGASRGLRTASRASRRTR